MRNSVFRLGASARAVAIITLVVASVAQPSFAQDESSASVFSDPEAAGIDLFTAYSELLVAKDVEALRELLDPAFLIVRGDGSFAGREDYLAMLPDLRGFALSEVAEVRSDDGVAIRMIAEADLTVDGEHFRAAPAPMLAAFRWDGERWSLVAQGNFNVPD